MKAAKNIKKKDATKGSCQKLKKPGHVKGISKLGTQSTKQVSVKSNSSTACPTEKSTNAMQTATDERRLRKLKVYLKSVSYNGCEGTILPNLNDLYVDSLLVDEFPCNELSKNEDFKCNPTPFVIASCFNRSHVTNNSKNTGRKNTGRRPPRKRTPTPRKKNQQTVETEDKSKQETAIKTNKPSMLKQQEKSPLRTERKTPTARRLFNEQNEKSKHTSPSGMNAEKVIKESLVKNEVKKAVKDRKNKTPAVNTK